MNVKLVASSDNRALEIRDQLLPVIRERGVLQVQRESVRVIGLQLGVFAIEHWTPFNDLDPEEASSPSYRHAVERQRILPDLSYGLDVWEKEKVLSVQWSEGGDFDVATFVRGPWEDMLLALADSNQS